METNSSKPLYSPAPNELQLTFRAVAVGCSLGLIVGTMNIYLGLKTGWTIGGSLIAAISSISFFQVMRPKMPFSVLEANIAQTAGSAAGSMASTAGLVACIPALKMLGYEVSSLELILWGLSVGYLGVFFAVPLREQMVVTEQLRFPTGTATAETIVAAFATGEEALAKSRKLLLWALMAGGFTLAGFFVPVLEHPPAVQWLGGAALAAWGFSLLLSPMMYGVGMIVGPQIGTSLFLGAVLAWGLLGPLAVDMGWASEKIMDYKTGPRGWVLWPGVALMVTDSLMSLVFSWKSIVNTFTKVRGTVSSRKDTVISQKAWFLGLGSVTLLMMTTAYWVFGIPPVFTIMAIVLSALLSLVATRSTGETDINPLGGMGKVTQMAFGAIDPGNVTTNLLAAGMTSAGANQAGDMMHDLKAGYLLGADPGKQFKAQCMGIFFGSLFVVPIYSIFDSAYTIGEGSVPAPAAHAWKAMAEVLTKGFSALPDKTLPIVALTCLFAIGLSLLKLNKKWKPWVPNGLAMGIAFIVPPYYSIAIFFGSLLFVVWKKRSPKSCQDYVYAVASGLIAGEGLMGVVKALLTLLGVQPLFPMAP